VSDPLSGTDWDRLLGGEFTSADWATIEAFLEGERVRGRVYPSADLVFRALELTWCQDTKAVVVGQDPYYSPGLADGLCFSVRPGAKIPASLRNIHNELARDLGLEPPDHGNLAPWAKHGVLLLNASLTVQGGAPRSHMGVWSRFTDAVIRTVVRERDPVVLLWGADAHAKEVLIRSITGSVTRVIKSSHPSPRSANRPCLGSPPFIGSSPFSQTNELLQGDAIDWNLTP
jgi:uracil-DNA glycosylase